MDVYSTEPVSALLHGECEIVHLGLARTSSLQKNPAKVGGVLRPIRPNDDWLGQICLEKRTSKTASGWKLSAQKRLGYGRRQRPMRLTTPIHHGYQWLAFTLEKKHPILPLR